MTLSVLQDEPLLKSGFVDGPWKRPLLKALEQASVPLQPGHSPFLSESQTIRTHISAIRAGAATTSHTLRGAEVKLLSYSVLLFPESNKIFCGYFDPETLFPGNNNI